MSKILVAYFSRAGENYFGGAIKSVAVGNTEICADLIKQAFPDADLFKIEWQRLTRTTTANASAKSPQT